MATEPIPVKAADLRRTDVAWHREAERFAVVSSLSAVPGTEEVQVSFLGEDEEVARQRYRAQEDVPLKRRGVNAERVIKAFCVPLGERASAWRSERRADHTFHAGFALAGDGYEFVGAWGPGKTAATSACCPTAVSSLTPSPWPTTSAAQSSNTAKATSASVSLTRSRPTCGRSTSAPAARSRALSAWQSTTRRSPAPFAPEPSTAARSSRAHERRSADRPAQGKEEPNG